MELHFRKGTMDDVEELSNLYDALNDYLDTHTNYPGWKKGIYPTDEDAIAGIEEDNLFVILDGERIAGTVILRHKPEEAYANATWKKELSYDEIYVIYTFAVHPDYMKQGVATELLKYAESYARQQGMKSMRLDVVADNIPAIATYEKGGFEYIDTVDLGLGEYGLDWFRLYEKLL